VITPIEFFGYDQCRCSAGFVGMPPHGCKPCPPHLVCNSTKGRNVAWPRGFYPVFSAGTVALNADARAVVTPGNPPEANRVRRVRRMDWAGEWIAALPCPDYGLGSDSVCNPENSCSARWNSKQLSFGCQLCAPGTTGMHKLLPFFAPSHPFHLLGWAQGGSARVVSARRPREPRIRATLHRSAGALRAAMTSQSRSRACWRR
jgi:hypothetical protein